jgi:hypothetical protein
VIPSRQLDWDDCRANERCANSSPRWTSRFAQQMRSNSALRNRTNHYAPALLVGGNGVLRKALWWVSRRGSLDGMQGVRGSNPLSSTRHNATTALPIRAVCQQIVSRSLFVTDETL